MSVKLKQKIKVKVSKGVQKRVVKAAFIMHNAFIIGTCIITVITPLKYYRDVTPQSAHLNNERTQTDPVIFKLRVVIFAN